MYQALREQHHRATGVWPDKVADKELYARSVASSEKQIRDDMFTHEGGDYILQALLKNGEILCNNKVIWDAPKSLPNPL